MLQGTVVCIMWHLDKLCPKQLQREFFVLLILGCREKKTRFIFREHLLLEVNDWTNVLPFHPISAVLLLGLVVWTLVCTQGDSKATDEVND